MTHNQEMIWFGDVMHLVFSNWMHFFISSLLVFRCNKIGFAIAWLLSESFESLVVCGFQHFLTSWPNSWSEKRVGTTKRIRKVCLRNRSQPLV